MRCFRPRSSLRCGSVASSIIAKHGRVKIVLCLDLHFDSNNRRLPPFQLHAAGSPSDCRTISACPLPRNWKVRASFGHVRDACPLAAPRATGSSVPRGFAARCGSTPTVAGVTSGGRAIRFRRCSYGRGWIGGMDAVVVPVRGGSGARRFYEPIAGRLGDGGDGCAAATTTRAACPSAGIDPTIPEQRLVWRATAEVRSTSTPGFSSFNVIVFSSRPYLSGGTDSRHPSSGRQRCMAGPTRADACRNASQCSKSRQLTFKQQARWPRFGHGQRLR